MLFFSSKNIPILSCEGKPHFVVMLANDIFLLKPINYYLCHRVQQEQSNNLQVFLPTLTCYVVVYHVQQPPTTRG